MKHAADADRYVSWNDLKIAVAGNETMVLDALGIPWRDTSGGRHITCPYGDHNPDTNPSWRWDEAARRAHCSCIGRNRNDKYKSHGIVEVVALIKGLDFDPAKIFVAEAINRSDLIKTKGRAGSASSPKALLDPPENQRDDSLVHAYLAHRLNIHPAEVVLPTTRAVGWSNLAYFDGSQTPVTSCPCAVFEQIDRTGAIHAMRIYLAHSGAGKAILPLRPDGTQRDPKKSAAKGDEARTAGRSVVWGDADLAETVIVTEGVETGAACAHALKAEITNGVVAVMATISTAGMTAWQPWLATRRLIIAADRDEDVQNSTFAGEKAARSLATRLHKDLEHVALALPGVPFTACDWLDRLLDIGTVIREELLSAPAFEPSEEEIATAAATQKVGIFAYTESGELRAVMHNAIALFERAFYGTEYGFGYDIFAECETFTGKVPWNSETVHRVKVNDSFVRLATAWLQEQGVFVRPNVANEAIQVLAERNRYNPLHDWRRSLEWDSVPRIDTFLIDFLGVAEFGEFQKRVDEEHNSLTKADFARAELHSRYVRAVSSQFFIRVQARIKTPGCKADEVLCLVGGQGVKKSSTVERIVGREWFSDQFPKIGDKDGALQMVGKLVIEFADNARTSKTDIEQLKAFLASPVDRFRKPYDVSAEDHPRICTFIITTNDDEHLRDPTGARRFRSVTCLLAKPELLTDEIIRQLWAEAATRCDAGEQWWLDGELAEYAKDIANKHMHEDSWTADIVRWSESNPSVARAGVPLNRLFVEALFITDRARHTRGEEMRLADLLKRLSWKKKATSKYNVWRAP